MSKAIDIINRNLKYWRESKAQDYKDMELRIYSGCPVTDLSFEANKKDFLICELEKIKKELENETE
jgi:hypothetical protein